MKSIMLLLGVLTLMATTGCVAVHDRGRDDRGGWRDEGYGHGEHHDAFPHTDHDDYRP
jgi:hypothetical protein